MVKVGGDQRHSQLMWLRYFSCLTCVLLFLYYTLLSLSGNFGRLTRVRLQQPQEQRYPVLQVHAGSFCVSVIHRILTWTTGSLTYVRYHIYACVLTRGLGTPTTSQHMFDKLDLCEEGSFSTAIFNSDIQLRFVSFSCFISVCPFCALLKATYA